MRCMKLCHRSMESMENDETKRLQMREKLNKRELLLQQMRTREIQTNRQTVAKNVVKLNKQHLKVKERENANNFDGNETQFWNFRGLYKELPYRVNGIQNERDQNIWDETELMKWYVDYFKDVCSKNCAMLKIEIKME